MTTADPSLPRTLAPPQSESTERFADAVRSLRTRSSSGQADRALLIVGGVLLPLGVLVVILGWLGAAHNVLVFEQVPYLISGGMLGLALTVVGGFVYFNYWQAVGVRESRAQHRELVTALGRIEQLLDPAYPSSGARAPGASAPAAASLPGHATAVPGAAYAPVAAPADTLVATANGTTMHRADCPVVAGKDNLRPVSPGEEGLEPCRICHPLEAVAD